MSDFTNEFPPVSLLRQLPASVAIERRVVPLELDGNGLIVAFAVAPSETDLSQLKVILARPITAVVKDAEWIDLCIQEFYSENCDEETNIEDFKTCFFRSHWSSIDACGTIRIRISGYEGTSHWSGVASFESDHPEYLFWKWVVSMSDELRNFNEDRIPELKSRWSRSHAAAQTK